MKFNLKNKNPLKFFAILSIFLICFSFIPNFSYATDEVKLNYDGWVKCDGVEAIDPITKKPVPGEEDRQTRCTFWNLISMVRSLINWAFAISIPVIIGLCAYAGFLFMTGRSGDREKAKKMLTNAVWGFIIALMAWFIVSTLLKWILSNENGWQNVAGTLIEQQ